MKQLVLAISALSAAYVLADWKTAEPGWQYEFPRDHHAHPEFKTEWWYFTGNLQDTNGRRFGYQLTFFRQGIRPPNEQSSDVSRFVTRDLKFAHFTITDVAGNRFRFAQSTSRGAFGEAGFDDGTHLAWIDDWDLQLEADGALRLRAETSEQAIELQLSSDKPPAIHGKNGISAKAASENHASHYYSLPRLTSRGDVRIGRETFHVVGESWFDHEWATNQLAPEQVGWNWLSVQFDDGTELMLYQMRLENGAPDPSSSGTWIDADGATTHLPNESFRMTPLAFWKSTKTGANYPIKWQIDLPARRVSFVVNAAIADQELALTPLAYWEGAIDADGTRDGQPLKGRGYLELTGYASQLRELAR